MAGRDGASRAEGAGGAYCRGTQEEAPRHAGEVALWALVGAPHQSPGKSSPHPRRCFRALRDHTLELGLMGSHHATTKALPENILVRGPGGGVVPLGGDPTVKTTGEGLVPARAPGCRLPPKPAEGAGGKRWGSGPAPPSPAPPQYPPWPSLPRPISMGFSCRLSVLPESGACACAPNAAFRSRSVRRPVLRDLRARKALSVRSQEQTRARALIGASPHPEPTHLPKGPLVSSGGRRPEPSCGPCKGAASERSGSVRFRGGVTTTPCRARRASRFWELGVFGKSKAGTA